VVDLAVLGVDAYLLSTRSTTTVVDLQDALVNFRASSGATTTTTSAPAGGGEVAGAAVVEPATAPTAAPTTVPEATTSSSSVPTSVPATPKAGTLAPPEPGVYRYKTSGGESVSLLGSSHKYPAETFMVVKRTGGCGWTSEAQVVKEHVDRRTMCTDDQQVAQSHQQRQITFFGTTDGANLKCTPPQVMARWDDQVGATRTARCAEGGVVADMVLEVKALGTAVVDGVTVETITYRIEGLMTGRVAGTSLDINTVVRATGLPVRAERWADTVANAFGADVRYQEHVTFDLLSLTPAT
jgi:hypothetical protein